MQEQLGKSNELPEGEISAWELRMVQLVGLKDESLERDAEDAIDSAIGQLTPEQEEFQTEQPLSSNPFVKLSFVGSATLAIVLIAGVFLSQVMNTSQPKSKKNNLISTEPQVQFETESYQQQLESEVELLKTKLALAEQAEAVKIAQQNLRKEQPKPKPKPQLKPKPTVKLASPSKPIPLPTPAVSMPRVVTVKPSVRQTPPPEKTKPDPFKEWLRLAKLGSYGQVSHTVEPRLKPEPQNPISEPTPPSENSVVAAEQEQKTKSVVVGSSAKAVLATAVFGKTTQKHNANEEETFFVVRLQEPLKTFDGDIALPVNAELLVKIRSLSDRGLLQLDVAKVILQNNDNLIEKSLPSNTIAINAPEGKPLLAQQFPNQAKTIASMDTALFFLGGLGKAAELLNRTESQVITTSQGGTVISNNNSQRNLLAGMVEGGIQTMVPLIAQRNQQHISQMMQQTNVWFLPAGTKVELYVNQMMQL